MSKIEVLLPAELKTERFVMKPLSLEDKFAWMDFINSQDALRFISFIKSTEEACEEWILRQQERYRNNEGGLFGMYLDDVLIGQCGLLVQEIDDVMELEIGYHVLPEYWKNGFAHEASKAWKDYAFQNRFSKSIISMIHIGNMASQAVASKNGMTKEKETFYKELPVAIYRITYAEWMQEVEHDEIA